jgi:N-acetylglucosaminyldiphosphoundecaprenol N-acetyl-beta-D-mannosaminyltransferase
MDKYKDQVVFPKAAPIAILGVPFDNVTTAETIQMIEQMVASRRPHYLATANVDFLVQASHDVELRRILFDAHLVLCDGTPLVWASRLLGNPLPERVAGSDLVPLLLKTAAEKGFRPFFLGASPEAMETAVTKVRAQYPQLDVAGFYSPPFNRLLEMDHDEIRNRIFAAQPDLLFVGFGCPKQEKWINMHYRSLGVPVSVGVGGTIDFLAGKLARAPQWMQRSGTEWLFRLAQEPKRLLGRYSNDLWHFGRGISAQMWRLRHKRPRKSAPPKTSAPASESPGWTTLRFPERLDIEEVHLRKDEAEAAIRPDRPCLIDLQDVQFIDSTGVGLLIRLQKRARMAGQQLVLVNLNQSVRRALQLMRLEEFFVIAASVDQAADLLRNAGSGSSVHLKSIPSAPLPALAWNGELTAANSEETWIATMDHLAARALVQRSITIDLGNLDFIDSTGLGVMIRAKKYAARQQMTLQFANAKPNVLNVIQLSRLEDYLLGSSPVTSPA